MPNAIRRPFDRFSLAGASGALAAAFFALAASAGAQTNTLGLTTAGPVDRPSALPRIAPGRRSVADSAAPVVGSLAGCGIAVACQRSLATNAIRSGAHHDWWAPLASSIAPGAGQARLGQDRFVGYMAVESFLWIRYLTDRRAGTDARNAYRDLAVRVSRAEYPGPKPQGNFEYYERMEHWIASGVYDSDPSDGFAPEVDTTTFNGKMWSIARTTYWSDPRVPPPIGSAAYEAAIRFYVQNAVPPEFQWSWRNARYHQDVYRRSVRASNDGFRHAAQDIGAVIANHVLSTVDAYISLRLRLHETEGTGESNVGIGATLPFGTIDRALHRGSRHQSTR